MRLRCGDEQREVTLREGPEGLEVSVDGKRFRILVEEVAPGAFVVRLGTRIVTFHCVRAGDTIHLHWQGVTYRLREERDGGRAAPRPISAGLEAPMPGKVIAVQVRPGQQVRKGEEMLVVEAMKMENALRAPREGRVKSVSVREGDMVSPGVVLVELE